MIFCLFLLSCLKDLTHLSKVNPQSEDKIEQCGIELKNRQNLFRELFDASTTYFSEKERFSAESIAYSILLHKEWVNDLLNEIEDRRDNVNILKQKDDFGRTIFHFTFLSRNYALCKRVLSLDSEGMKELLKEKDNNGMNCLHYLAFFNFLRDSLEIEESLKKLDVIDVRQYLELFQEEDLLAEDDLHLTPLHYAIYFRDIVLIKELLNKMNDVNRKALDSKVNTLDLAIFFGDIEVISALLNKELKAINKISKERVLSREESGLTILNSLILEFLKEKKDEVFLRIISLLDNARRGGYLQQVLDQKDSKGRKAINISLHPDLLRILYNNSFTSLYSRDNPTLYYAVNDNKINAIKAIKELCPNEINCLNTDGMTPLDRAVQLGNQEILELLLTFPTLDDDTKNKGFVLSLDNLKIAKVIYSKGIDPRYVVDQVENTLLMKMLAKVGKERDRENDKEVEESLSKEPLLMMESEGRGNDKLEPVIKEDVRKENSSEIEYFIMKIDEIINSGGYDLDYINRDGDNLLHLLVKNNMKEELSLVMNKLNAEETIRILNRMNFNCQDILLIAINNNNALMTNEILKFYGNEREAKEKFAYNEAKRNGFKNVENFLISRIKVDEKEFKNMHDIYIEASDAEREKIGYLNRITSKIFLATEEKLRQELEEVVKLNEETKFKDLINKMKDNRKLVLLALIRALDSNKSEWVLNSIELINKTIVNGDIDEKITILGYAIFLNQIEVFKLLLGILNLDNDALGKIMKCISKDQVDILESVKRFLDNREL